MNKINPFEIISNELHLIIFSYLQKKDLGNCCQVGVDWKRVAEDDVLWTQLLKKKFPNSIHCTMKNAKNLFKILEVQQSCKTFTEVLVRIQNFIERVQLGQNARFRCVFPDAPFSKVRLQTITIAIKGDTKQSDIRRDGWEKLINYSITEDCFAKGCDETDALMTKKEMTFIGSHGYSKDGHDFRKNNHPPFSVIFTFPYLKDELISIPRANEAVKISDFEDKVLQKINSKIEQLRQQDQDRNRTMNTIAACVVALFSFVLYSYLNITE